MTVEGVSPDIRPGCTAAFQLHTGAHTCLHGSTFIAWLHQEESSSSTLFRINYGENVPACRSSE